MHFVSTSHGITNLSAFIVLRFWPDLAGQCLVFSGMLLFHCGGCYSAFTVTADEDCPIVEDESQLSDVSSKVFTLAAYSTIDLQVKKMVWAIVSWMNGDS